MKNAFLRVGFGCLCVLTMSSGRSSQAAVILNSEGQTKLEAVARDRNFSFPENTINTLTPTSLPFSNSHTATAGNSTATVQYAFAQQEFTISSTNVRDGSLDSRANAQGDVFFSVSTNTPYALSGFFNAVDPSAKAVGMTATLTDLGTSEVLFHNDQSSFGQANKSFILGQTQGNTTNALAGALNGLLQAGHSYKFYYGNSLYAANSGQAASASGQFQLSLVPEPSSANLGIISIVGLLVSLRSERLKSTL